MGGNIFKIIAQMAGKHAVGTATAFTIGVAGVGYKVYQDSKTGNVVGVERVEKTVAKNDAQGDVHVKIEGLKEMPKDAKAEAVAKAAGEAQKAGEARKPEEALKAQREAEKAAMLPKQQAQDEETPEEKNETPEGEQEGESNAEAKAGDDENAYKEGEDPEDSLAYDTSKGGSGEEQKGDTDETEHDDQNNNEQQLDENGNPITKENPDDVTDETKEVTDEVDEEQGKDSNNKQQLDENGNPITEENPDDVTDETKEVTDEVDEEQGKDSNNKQQLDENGNPITKENPDDVTDETKEVTDEVDEEQGKDSNNKQQLDENGNPITEGNPGDVTDETKGNTNVDESQQQRQEPQQNNVSGQSRIQETVDSSMNRGSETYASSQSKRESSVKHSKSTRSDIQQALLSDFKKPDNAFYWLDYDQTERLVPSSDYTSWVQWAIYHAANHGLNGSEVKELGFTGFEILKEKMSQYIADGVHDILHGDGSLNPVTVFKGKTFIIHGDQMLTEMDESVFFRRMSWYPDGENLFMKESPVKVKLDRTDGTRVILIAEQNMLDALKEYFKVCNWNATVTAGEIRACGGSESAWENVIGAAADGNAGSRVTRLTIKGAEREKATFLGIGFGLHKIIWEQNRLPGDLANRFEIEVPFELDGDAISEIASNASVFSGNNDGVYTAERSGGQNYAVTFDTSRSLIIVQPTQTPSVQSREQAKAALLKMLEERFKNDSASVSEDEVWAFQCNEPSGTGIKTVLKLAASPGCKLKELTLPGVREPNDLKDAYLEICAQEEINQDLVVVTNLRWENGVADLEDAINASEVKQHEISINGDSGQISFVKNWRITEQKSALNSWNSKQKDIATYFKRKKGTWKDLVDTVWGPSGNNAAVFKLYRIDAHCVLFATNFDSYIEEFDVGEMNTTAFVNQVCKIFGENTPIHGFILKVDNAPALLAALEAKSQYRNSNHEIRLTPDKKGLRFLNGVEVPKEQVLQMLKYCENATWDVMLAIFGNDGDALKRELTLTDIMKRVAFLDSEVKVLNLQGSTWNLDEIVEGVLAVLKFKPAARIFKVISDFNPNDILAKVRKAEEYKPEYDAKIWEDGGALCFGRKVKVELKNALEEMRKILSANKDAKFDFGFLGEYKMPMIFCYAWLNSNDYKELENLNLTYCDLEERIRTGAASEDDKKVYERMKELGYVAGLDVSIIDDVLSKDCDEIKDNHDLQDKIKAFGDKDLILKATCYYKENRYASSHAEKVLKETDTRNYFLHPWVAKSGEYDSWMGNTTVVAANGISICSKFDDTILGGLDSDGAVNPHLGAEGVVYYSPNNSVFRIKEDGAQAWFISKCPGKGTSKIAVHWTFVRDNDGALYKRELKQRRHNNAGDPFRILPSQFSSDLAERDVAGIEAYLRLKKFYKALATDHVTLDKATIEALGESLEEICKEITARGSKVKILTITDDGVEGNEDTLKALLTAVYDGFPKGQLETLIIGNASYDAIKTHAESLKGGTCVRFEAEPATCTLYIRALKIPTDKEWLQGELQTALDDGKEFELKVALERGMRVQEVFTEALSKHAEGRISFSDFNEKADADGWIELLCAFQENQNKVFEKEFIDTWARDDDAWTVLKAQIEGAFRSRGEAMYAHLDKVNKRLWIDKVEEVLQLGADSNGDLRWTDELKAWWCNPSNTVADFAKALAETSGITKVDFTGLFEGVLGLSPASLSFVSNPVIHRYWDANALAALAKCSGMTFRLVVLKSRRVKDLQKIVKDLRGEFFDDCKDENISEDKCCWDIKMKKDKCFGVEDNGENRLLWNATARELLLAAFGMDADGLKKLDEDRNPIVLTDLEKKNALETFAQAVLDAKGSREHIDGIDFAVPAATDVALFDVVRWSVQDKELWIVLKEKFGDKDGFKFFVRRDDIDNVEIGPGKKRGVEFFSKELGWKVLYNNGSKVFEITVSNHGEPHFGEEPGDE